MCSNCFVLSVVYSLLTHSCFNLSKFDFPARCLEYKWLLSALIHFCWITSTQNYQVGTLLSVLGKLIRVSFNLAAAGNRARFAFYYWSEFLFVCRCTSEKMGEQPYSLITWIKFLWVSIGCRLKVSWDDERKALLI